MTKAMTLQESIQKLKDITHQSDALYQRIYDNHLHTEGNKLLCERWFNTRSQALGEKIRDEMGDEKEEWEQYLKLFPLPDKPFDINDVKDEEFKSCIQEIEKLEEEDHKLFSYILDTFNSKEDKKIIKEYLSTRFIESRKNESDNQ